MAVRAQADENPHETGNARVDADEWLTKMKHVVCTTALMLVSWTAHASDTMVLSCPVCHGAASSITPTLRGHSAAEIETLLRAYRDGSRKGTAMPRLTAAMSDAEIRQLAEFYAEQRP